MDCRCCFPRPSLEIGDCQSHFSTTQLQAECRCADVCTSRQPHLHVQYPAGTPMLSMGLCIYVEPGNLPTTNKRALKEPRLVASWEAAFVAAVGSPGDAVSVRSLSCSA
jgi:hypothetical protein